MHGNLRFFEAQEPRNDGLSSEYCLYIYMKKSKKNHKNTKSYFDPGSVKSEFKVFPGMKKDKFCEKSQESST